MKHNPYSPPQCLLEHDLSRAYDSVNSIFVIVSFVVLMFAAFSSPNSTKFYSLLVASSICCIVLFLRTRSTTLFLTHLAGILGIVVLAKF